MDRASRIQVFGPAYLDRVVRVDRALVPPGSPPLDQSIDGLLTFGRGLVLRDPEGATIAVDLPEGWPGPWGAIALSRGLGIADLRAQGISWNDDLGGMGAGYAAALGGELVCVLGAADDPTSRDVSALLDRSEVRHRAVRVAGASADWTLVVTSGPFGDKLPVGFRGCLDRVESLRPEVVAAGPCDVRVVASFPNRLAGPILRDPSARLRVFAPTTRNMTDREFPMARFAESIDVLCCNRREWEGLDDREQVAWQVSILAVTDGPNGSLIRFTTPQGEPGRIEVPAFARTDPPRDTNRAGEAYASTLIASLLDLGWRGGVVEPALIEQAAGRAAVAAALELDLIAFGFPGGAEIDAALRSGPPLTPWQRR
jgi:hypothetical protein